MGDYGDYGGYGGRRASGGYGGHHGKRKRESEAFDTLKQLLHSLIYLGDDVLPVRGRAGLRARGPGLH